MGFSIVPNPVSAGAHVIAKVRYRGSVPPKPTDVHIDARQPDGSWRAVTGYDHIPETIDPVEGFDLPFSAGNPNIGGVGEHILRLRWTLEGRAIGAAELAQLDVVPAGSGAQSGSATPDDALRECGDDCYIIEYETGTPVATSWHNDAGDTTVYAMPTPNDGNYGFGYAPGMRDAFAAAAAKVKAKYTPYAKGCSGRCVCQKDKDAKTRESTPWSVPVTASYTYPDGSGTATVTGSFEVKQLKTPGTCRPK